MNGKQGGDPAKLADALVQLAGLKEPPVRFAAGADAVQTFEAKGKTLLAQADMHRALSSSLSFDNAVDCLTRARPDFFAGTVVEPAVAARRPAARVAAAPGPEQG